MEGPSTSSTITSDPEVGQRFEIIWLLLHAYLLFFMQVGGHGSSCFVPAPPA
jgi:hypothetical protein